MVGNVSSQDGGSLLLGVGGEEGGKGKIELSEKIIILRLELNSPYYKNNTW